MIYYLATPLLIMSAFPQTIRLLRKKTSEDISLWTYIITMTGVLLILARAIEIGDLAIIMSNGASLILMGINTTLVIRYRKKGKRA